MRTPCRAASPATCRASIWCALSCPSDRSTITREAALLSVTLFSASPSPSAMAVERPVMPIEASSMARPTRRQIEGQGRGHVGAVRKEDEADPVALPLLDEAARHPA
ncbi:hypothetical protein [Cereibacter sphaeroides]|uniref:hypothetical protein n=1 Tax=Cereibacter sphaeroides TaxID=1063 RepID=UPI0021565216|nr:hypothetical protein [Cereibacter sphaeroides]